LEQRRLLATLTVTTTADTVAVDGFVSLREAIDTANNNAEADTIEFNIPETDVGFNASNPIGSQWWTIQLASDLPTLTESGTRILGSTQTANQGNTNAGQLGSGGFVGVDNLPLSKYERPEIAINVNGNKSFNMVGAASSIQIEGLAIHGDTGTNSFGGGGGNDALISSNGTGTGRVIGPDAMGNGNAVIVGLLPDGTVPAVRQDRFGIRTHSSTTTTVRNSLVAENGRGGIDGVASSTVLNVYGSEVFNNGWNSVDHDGIDVNGINGQVIGNLSYNNTTSDGLASTGAGNGIELGSQSAGTGGNVVRNNTSFGNVSAGIGIRAGSTGNTVDRNVLYGNEVGISVNDENRGQTDANDLTRNSIFNNRRLGIDLTPVAAGVGAYDGVTLNDQDDVDTGANQLTNFPIIDNASISAGSLTITGFAEPGARIELFIAAPDPTGFGEGQTFVASFTEGSGDLDSGTGVYGPNFAGLAVSSVSITSNRFRFVVPAGIVTPGTPLTATATVAGSTSEFAPVVTAAGAPQEVQPGQTATIGFWRNKNGQNLLRSVNEGLGDWLATEFPNLYGVSSNHNLTGKTNAEVAALYTQKKFNVKGQKLDAQVMAVAFAMYVTDVDLAGTAAEAYGFTVDSVGLGGSVYNVGSNGAAFGVPNGSVLTVREIMDRTNDRANDGLLWDLDDDDRISGSEQGLRNMANTVFTGINEQGDI
jgi:CSLREA domain-containing protein